MTWERTFYEIINKSEKWVHSLSIYRKNQKSETDFRNWLINQSINWSQRLRTSLKLRKKFVKIIKTEIKTSCNHETLKKQLVKTDKMTYECQKL